MSTPARILFAHDDQAFGRTLTWILDEHGSIREHINVFVNRDYGREDTAVGAGDRLHVIPAISGG